MTNEHSDGRWTGRYEGFLDEGAYPIIVYAVDDEDNLSEPMRTTVIVTADNVNTIIEEYSTSLPTEFGLKTPYPNPFNSEIVLDYGLPHSSAVELVVYNGLGQRIRTLVNSRQKGGFYRAIWDGKNDTGNTVASGIFIVRLLAGPYSRVHKVAFIK